MNHYRNDPRYVTLKQYVTLVVADPRRVDELETLTVLFGMEKLEQVLDGKVIVTPDNFIRGD